MGIFLNGLLRPKISPLPAYKPPCFIKNRPFPTIQIHYRLLVQDTALLHQFLSDTHHFPSLDTTHFQISFRTPVLASPDEAPNPKASKTVPVRNGINPANAGKNPPSIFMLRANCVFDSFYDVLIL